MRWFVQILFALHAPLIGSGCTKPCNGSENICEKQITDVVFPATHNANAALEYEYSFANANQTSGIQKQLEDGIRAMLLDVTYDSGETVLCHSICALGKTPHVEALGWVTEFLEQNPREVLVFLYQDSISMSDLEADFKTSGLIEYAYAHDSSEAWPTIEDLIQAEKRLIVTTEHGKGPPNWVHHLWDVAWDTPYSFDTKEDFTCDHNRGKPGNPFFLMNHWLSGPYGLPSQDEAAIANNHELMFERAMECWSQNNQRPNFIAVDWYEEGDLFQVVAELNDSKQ